MPRKRVDAIQGVPHVPTEMLIRVPLSPETVARASAYVDLAKLVYDAGCVLVVKSRELKEMLEQDKLTIRKPRRRGR